MQRAIFILKKIIMKYVLAIFAIFLTVVVYSQTGLEKITETDTGWRLIGQHPDRYGPIGLNAIDLSISSFIASDMYGATGSYSIAGGNYSTASGQWSISLGRFGLASGQHATALGAYNSATGDESMAMGYGTYATGTSSTSMGKNTSASGDYATAAGLETIASGYGSTAIGVWNSAGGANPTTFSSTNRAFMIGNGTASNARSNAMTVLFNGNTTISGSVTAPSFIGDGAGLTNLPVSGLESITEISTGWRLAGRNPSHYGNIGTGAVDLSRSTTQSTTRGATGNISIAFGSITIASGNVSTAMGFETTASGNYSTASGGATVASGSYATATGSLTTASGTSSTAMGSASTATGYHSTALGSGTSASGSRSTSLGYQTVASGFGTTSIGAFNTIDSTANPTTNSATNRALVIGNGSDTNSRSDALTVLFNGNTTISGTVSAPSFIGDGSQLSSLGLKVITEQGNTGWRLTGQDSAHYGDIGLGAVDMSNSSSSSLTKGATGNRAFASGYNTTASGNYSTAMGTNSRALGNESTAVGYYAAASGQYAVAMGGGTLASAFGTTAIGIATTASGYHATAMGSETDATGYNSTAMGLNTMASGYGTTAIGLFNTIDSSAVPTTYSLTNRAFVIGNGTNSIMRSDAMTVLFDGTTTIAGDLTVNSDARLKSNIMPLGSTLSLLQVLDGKTYHLNNDESTTKIGLLAQDVQKVFPQLVKEAKDEYGTLSVNYQGLIPVLINAVNEQQETIEIQQKQIEKLSVMVADLLHER